MSFLTTVAGSDDKDRRLAVVRKKYYHSILMFNQDFEKEKREAINAEKVQMDMKIKRVNQSALEILEQEIAAKREEKLIKQETLRLEYDRQIRQRREKLLQEREGDKKYVKLQQVETEKTSERRIADLMKIYDRAAVSSTHRRVKTDMDEKNNPEENRRADTSVQSYKRMPFLPAIERIQLTSILKNKPVENTSRIFNLSHENNFSARG